MGFRDVLNGMMNGPGGRRQPSTGRNTKGVPRIIWALPAGRAIPGRNADDTMRICGPWCAPMNTKIGRASTGRTICSSCVPIASSLYIDHAHCNPFSCAGRPQGLL